MEPLLAEELGSRIPSVLHALWHRRGMSSLLPLQRRALRETGLLAGRNLLVSAPSSAGKSLIGELAAARALAAGRRAILLSPTRALAEQQFAAFERGLAGLGLRVLCATSDRPGNDAPAAAGRFDVLVAVPEKLRSYLTAGTRTLAGAGAVVVDEIQLLADPQRGAALDLLITQILRSPYAPQVVALGPEMSNPQALAAWLGAELLRSTERPTPLFEGVLDLSDGSFRSLECGSPEAGEIATSRDRLFSPESLARWDERAREAAEAVRIPCGEEARALIAASASLALERGPALLFAPTRRCSRRWAGVLSAMEAGFSPARVALARLARLADRGRIVERLGRCLEAGVAFHNADLDAQLRDLVESAYLSGEVRLLVSTPTLGMGVNLAARSVVHAPWRWGSSFEVLDADDRGDSPGLLRRTAAASMPLPLGRARFVNQGGRAGRFGQGSKPGLSVLVARSPEEAERLWQTLIIAAPESLDLAPLAALTPGEIALGLLAGGADRTPSNLHREWQATWSAQSAAPPRAGGAAAFEPELEALGRAGLAHRNAHGYWGLTRLGEALLRGAVSPASLPNLRRAVEIRASGGDAWSTLHGLIRTLALIPEGELALASLPFDRRTAPLPLPEQAGDDDEGHAAGELDSARQLTRREMRSWYAASALLDWIDGAETRRIEQKYNVYIGGLASAAEAMAQLVFTTAAVARAFGSEAEVADSLAELGERLPGGLLREALPLGRMHVAGVSRDRLNALARAGLGGPEQVDALPIETLALYLDAESVEALKEATARWVRMNRPKDSNTPGAVKNPGASSPPARPVTPGRSALLEINLHSPGIVHARGREVQLPPLGFDLLIALAERPGEVVTRDALYCRLWPEGGPEDQQLDAHRRRLIGRLRPALGTDAVRVAEVVRGIGFRLTLGASHIQWRGGGRNGDGGAAAKVETGCAPVVPPG